MVAAASLALTWDWISPPVDAGGVVDPNEEADALMPWTKPRAVPVLCAADSSCPYALR